MKTGYDQKSEGAHLTTSSADLPISSLKKEQNSRRKTSVFLIAIVILTALLMAAIASAVALNEATVTASRLQKEIDQLKKQNRDHKWELERKNDMVYFEQYAASELGMLKGSETPTDERDDLIE